MTAVVASMPVRTSNSLSTSSSGVSATMGTATTTTTTSTSTSSSRLSGSSHSPSPSGRGMILRLPNQPTLIETGSMSFLVSDAPTDDLLPSYAAEFKAHNVIHVVRVCESTYSTKRMEDLGFSVHNFEYKDGGNPPEELLAQWMQLVTSVFGTGHQSSTIAVHCVAGLGRAPVLVAVALIEYGMAPSEAVSFIRSRRTGAINNKQLDYLLSYKPHFVKSKCCIM
ncbi:phosphatases II [Pelomyxa schiedti]|nr:phosphatases II [Pelomyxa schiedti]